MKRFLISLTAGFVVAILAYFGFAIPQYYDLLAHQPHYIVVDDTPNLSFALPKSQQRHLEVTDPHATSFPPSAAFVVMLPLAALTLTAATLLVWLVQRLFVPPPQFPSDTKKVVQPIRLTSEKFRI